jgi:peptide/nickel transport system permease protein
MRLEMARFILYRVGGLILTLLIASMLIYAAVYIAPGSPEAFLAGGRPVSPHDLAVLNAQYHLNDPLPVAYLRWLSGVVHGDLGTSVVSKESVTSLLAPRIATTGLLVAYASLLIVVVGIGSGIVAGLKPRLGGVIVGATSFAAAIPAFVAAVVLISIFGVSLRWFPSVGDGTGFGDRLYHLTLPAVALALAVVAYVSRITRVAVREELSKPHVDTARARGLPERWLIRRHVLRNAAIPITTVVGVAFAAVIGVVAVVETAFGLNGLGAYLVQSVSNRDFAVVQAICLIFVAAFVIVNTIVDVCYVLLDPRLGARTR